MVSALLATFLALGLLAAHFFLYWLSPLNRTRSPSRWTRFKNAVVYTFTNKDILIVTAMTFFGAFVLGDAQHFGLGQPVKELILSALTAGHLGLNLRRIKSFNSASARAA